MNFPSLCHFCDNEADEKVDIIYTSRFAHIRNEFLNTYNGKFPEHLIREHSERHFYEDPRGQTSLVAKRERLVNWVNFLSFVDVVR